jgi:aminopeptidase N
MEHQSAIAIGGDYGKDTSYPMVGKYDLLVVHETAHEWWGNAVAIGDMADVWINEGFATYAEHLFIEKEFGENKYIEAVGDNMFEIINIWPMVGKRDINYDAFLGGDVYNKGAAMLHSLRCVFDKDELFFLMIKDFYSNSKMKITTTNDFIEHAKKYTSKELDGFFEVFLYQSAPPVLEYSIKLKHGKLHFKYKWVNVPADFEMPFLVVFNYGLGYRLECSTKQGELIGRNVKDFYIFNQIDFDSEIDTKNAFTYFFSNYIK